VSTLTLRQATLADKAEVQRRALLGSPTELWSDAYLDELIVSGKYICVLDDPDGLFWIRSTDGLVVEAGPHYGFASNSSLTRYKALWKFTWALGAKRWPKWKTLRALMDAASCYAPGIYSTVAANTGMAQVGTHPSGCQVLEVSRATFEARLRAV